MGESHGEAEQVEFGAGFGGDGLEDCFLAIDFAFDGGEGFFGRCGVAEFEEAAEGAGDGAPLFAIVAADAADGADGDALLGPRAGGEGEAKHGAKNFGVARFAPEDAADFGIDVGGNESGDGGVVTGQTEGEVALELLFARKAGRQEVLPIGEDAEKTIGRETQFGEGGGLFELEAGLEEGRGVLDLGDEGLRGNPLGPGVGGRGDRGVGQFTSVVLGRRKFKGRSGAVSMKMRGVGKDSLVLAESAEEAETLREPDADGG